MALALAGAGAEVVICGRRAEPLAAIAAEAPTGAPAIRPCPCDVTDEAAIAALFADHGPFDIVVANAGIAESAPIARTGLDALERMLAVNLRGVFLPLREAARGMPDGGRFVAVASTAALKGYAYAGAYAASKHAVLGLVRSAALELAPRQITVNALCPGFMDTPMTAQSAARIAARTGRSEEDARAALAATNPMGRLVPPGDVAEALLWLCAPGAGLVTGQAIALSGGEI